jgi:hypothetical protein
MLQRFFCINPLTCVYFKHSAVNGKDSLNTKRGILSPITTSLWGTVTTVDDDIGAGGISGSIRGEVQISTLQLVRLTRATHRDLVPPESLELLGGEFGDFCEDIAGGDGVSAGKTDPFDGERFA